MVAGLGPRGSQRRKVRDSFVTKPLMDVPIFSRGAIHPVWKTPMNKSPAFLQQICSLDIAIIEFCTFLFIFLRFSNLILMIS